MKKHYKKLGMLKTSLLIIPCLQASLLGYLGSANAQPVSTSADLNFENQTLQNIPNHTPTAFANELQNYNYIKQAGYLKKDSSIPGKPWSVIYVNVAQSSKADIRAFREAYESGAVILLDATESTSQKMASISTAIGGLGLETPVLVMQYNHGKPNYLNVGIDLDDAQANRNNINYSALFTRAANLNDLTAPAATILDKLFSTNDGLDELSANTPHAANDATTLSQAANASATTPYAPIYTYYITSSRTVSCWLHESIKLTIDDVHWKGNPINRCTNGYAEMIWTVDLMRSVPAISSDGKSSIDAKYVRISVLNDAGGSGIHLVDKPTQYFTWHQSAAQWDDYFGPFANRYRFGIYPKDYSNITLVTNSPAQTNPNVDIQVSNSVTIGVGGSAGAEVNAAGPQANASVSASFAMTSSRTTTLARSEYMVRNNSSHGSAEWIWDRNFETSLCDWASYHGTGDWCWYPAVVWDNSHIMASENFSPIAYSNFSPAFSALYKTNDVGFTGIVDFKLKTGIDIRGIAGAARYGTIWQSRAVAAWEETSHNELHSIHVDFSRPVFYPEVNVILQSQNESDSCVYVDHDSPKDLARVIKAPCSNKEGHISKGHFWGLNSLEQYVSRVYPDRCLTAQDPLTIVISTCNTTNNNAKWYWQDNKLMSRYIDSQGHSGYRLGIVDGKLQLIHKNDQAGSDMWSNYMINPT